MGIVAYCPNGHRVKVKDELAGRKGICPECQARFRIPRDNAWRAGGYPVARVVSLDPAVAARLPRAYGLWSVAASSGSSRDPFPGPTASSIAAATPRSPTLHAALAEQPDLTWRVALPGGQPSEPMSAAAMQQWLDAGDVTGHELVWREGWADWVTIRLVFPERMPAAPG